MAKPHEYALRLTWDGNRGAGTANYEAYDRRYRVEIAGKPELWGSADPAFRGDPALYNPEDLLLAALSGCHMLSYLALCARRRIPVVAYEDDARGTLVLEPSGAGRFTEVTLRPRVTIASAAQLEEARALHERAHALCFIANSCNFPIRHEPLVQAL